MTSRNITLLNSANQNVLIAKRQVVIKLHEVPVAELDDYRSFVKRLRNDLDQYVPTSSANAKSAPDTPFGALPPILSSIWELPASDSENANRLELEARNGV